MASVNPQRGSEVEDQRVLSRCSIARTPSLEDASSASGSEVSPIPIAGDPFEIPSVSLSPEPRPPKINPERISRMNALFESAIPKRERQIHEIYQLDIPVNDNIRRSEQTIDLSSNVSFSKKQIALIVLLGILIGGLVGLGLFLFDGGATITLIAFNSAGSGVVSACITIDIIHKKNKNIEKINKEAIKKLYPQLYTLLENIHADPEQKICIELSQLRRMNPLLNDHLRRTNNQATFVLNNTVYRFLTRRKTTPVVINRRLAELQVAVSAKTEEVSRSGRNQVFERIICPDTHRERIIMHCSVLSTLIDESRRSYEITDPNEFIDRNSRPRRTVQRTIDGDYKRRATIVIQSGAGERGEVFFSEKIARYLSARGLNYPFVPAFYEGEQQVIVPKIRVVEEIERKLIEYGVNDERERLALLDLCHQGILNYPLEVFFNQPLHIRRRGLLALMDPCFGNQNAPEGYFQNSNKYVINIADRSVSSDNIVYTFTDPGSENGIQLLRAYLTRTTQKLIGFTEDGRPRYERSVKIIPYSVGELFPREIRDISRIEFSDEDDGVVFDLIRLARGEPIVEEEEADLLNDGAAEEEIAPAPRRREDSIDEGL